MLQTIKGKLILLLGILVIGFCVLGYQMILLSSNGKDTAIRLWTIGKVETHVSQSMMELRGYQLFAQAERFDAFADLPHYPFPGGQLLRTPLTALGAWYYSLRDKYGF